MVVLCCWLIFFRTQPPLLFTLFAPVMLVTFRAGRIGTMIAVTLVAVIGAIGTIADTGPIAAFTQDHGQQALLFQLYLAFLLLTSLPVASVLSERNLRTQELVQSEKSALRLASTDSLTGLLNRPAFIASVERAFQAEGDRVFSLIIVDVDHFKQVNDCWGHMAGDRALIHIGGILARQCREHDTIARMGGDEFMLLLRDTPTDIAVAICERVSLTLRQASLDVDGKTKAILSISCGVASSRGHASFEDVYGAADQALYHAKSAGRNRAVASASQVLAGENPCQSRFLDMATASTAATIAPPTASMVPCFDKPPSSRRRCGRSRLSRGLRRDSGSNISPGPSGSRILLSASQAFTPSRSSTS
jgi:diguanylate cyclase (GGDEF)-like protein